MTDDPLYICSCGRLVPLSWTCLWDFDGTPFTPFGRRCSMCIDTYGVFRD